MGKRKKKKMEPNDRLVLHHAFQLHIGRIFESLTDEAEMTWEIFPKIHEDRKKIKKIWCGRDQ